MPAQGTESTRKAHANESRHPGSYKMGFALLAGSEFVKIYPLSVALTVHPSNTRGQ